MVHEVKKSDKRSEAHLWQLKYYLYVLEQNGVENCSGLLEYPRLHKTEEVLLTIPDREAIKEMIADIKKIIHDEDCPPRLPRSQCKNCSYFDFCHSGENS